MKKLLCLIILLFSFIRSEAQSDHICPHEKLYVHTDRANYERGDTVRFRAYLMDTRREATAYSRYVYAELLADSQVISREMVKDDHGVFSGYLSLGDTLRSGNYTLRFYTRHLSSLPAPRYFYRQIIVGRASLSGLPQGERDSYGGFLPCLFLSGRGTSPFGLCQPCRFQGFESRWFGNRCAGLCGQSAWRYRHHVAFRPSGDGLLQS